MMSVEAPVRLTKQERRWQAENDARTLAESKVILDDAARLIAAKRAALNIAKKDQDQVDAMKAVSKTKPVKGVKKREAKKKTVKQTYNVFKML